jgi:hypothetical protein
MKTKILSFRERQQLIENDRAEKATLNGGPGSGPQGGRSGEISSEARTKMGDRILKGDKVKSGGNKGTVTGGDGAAGHVHFTDSAGNSHTAHYEDIKHTK